MSSAFAFSSILRLIPHGNKPSSKSGVTCRTLPLTIPTEDPTSGAHPSRLPNIVTRHKPENEMTEYKDGTKTVF